MKAHKFRYERATTLEGALELLAHHGDDARVIAGGQSLVPALNLRLATPTCLVDIGRLAALRGIRVERDGGRERLRIGALVRHVEIERSPEVARCAPLLGMAVKYVAHAAIRNRGTFGGSIAHADPAAEFPACALTLGARMHIASRGGRRIVAAADFFKGNHETALRPGEILVEVEIDATPEGWRSGFAELARRQGDYAMVGLAMHVRPRRGRMLFEEAIPVFFAIDDRPILAKEAARILTDATVDDQDRIRLAQDALGRDLNPSSSPVQSAAACLHRARVILARVVAEVAALDYRELIRD